MNARLSIILAGTLLCACPGAPDTEETTQTTAAAPEAPLRRWMKGNAAPAMSALDFAGLERDFAAIATFAPSGWSEWSTIARRGEIAAGARDAAGVRQACKGCHDTYRAQYVEQMRDRPLP